MVLSLLFVDVVESLGLDYAVNEGTSEASNDLLCLSMAVRVALAGDMVLISLGSLGLPPQLTIYYDVYGIHTS